VSPFRNPCRYAYGSETMTAPPRIASHAVWASPSRKRKASNASRGIRITNSSVNPEADSRVIRLTSATW